MAKHSRVSEIPGGGCERTGHVTDRAGSSYLENIIPTAGESESSIKIDRVVELVYAGSLENES